MSLAVLGILLGAWSRGIAQVPGNPDRQERGDLEWRRLQALIDDHPAVYDFYAVGDPGDKAFHFLIEMEGPNLLIRDLTLQTFIDDGPQFFGAYMRSGGIATRAARLNIIKTAQRLRDLGSIGYVDDFRDYIYIKSLGTNGRLDPDEIIGMRSDAFGEYCYAFNNFPNLVLSGFTVATNPGFFQDQSRSAILTPRTHRTAMAAATIENPVAVVRDERGGIIDNGAATNTRSITVDVVDERSGPGRLELWKGDPDAGGTRLASSFLDFPVDGVRYVYSSSDQGLEILADLPEGQYTVRAIDQAGNFGSESELRFLIARTPPTITVVDGVGELLDGYSTANGWVNISAAAVTPNVPLKSLRLFADGNYSSPLAEAQQESSESVAADHPQVHGLAAPTSTARAASGGLRHDRSALRAARHGSGRLPRWGRHCRRAFGAARGVLSYPLTNGWDGFAVKGVAL